jgi:hypothetical protein
MRPYRFPQLAVRCDWCKAPVGEFCTNPRTGRARRSDTHTTRLDRWVTDIATCPACEGAPGHPCAGPGGMPGPVHEGRRTAAARAYTANTTVLDPP